MTREDVAKFAGVSKSTVSRVLNNNGYVSDDNRRRVEEAIKAMGYKPNLIARSLKMKETHQILFYSPELLNPFYMEVYQGMADYAEQHGYTIVVSRHFDEGMVRQRQFDGVILSRVTPNKRNEALKVNVPIVTTDFVEHDGFGSVIGVDFQKGAYEIVNHLIGMGHRRIAFITYNIDVKDDQRLCGYLNALRDAGIKRDDKLIICDGRGANNYDHGFNMAGRLIDESAGATAIFAFNDMLAIGAISALAQRGVRIPDDVSIAGFDNLLEAQYAAPPLTTMDVPKYELGRISARMVLDMIGGSKPEAITLEPKLIERSSVRRI